MYTIVRLQPDETENFAAFLNDLYVHHWSLTSQAYQREPNSKKLVRSEALIEELNERKHVSIFLLKKADRIISSIRVKIAPDKVIFSHVETHPDFQKRGVFGLTLADACIRTVCEYDCKRIEITTWSFNRKGIPLYKRYGFRAVPGTNLLMENYLPVIVKHPDAQPYFARHDYIRTLQNERSYGHDAVEVNGLSVFEYRWKSRKADDTLRVLVDWHKKKIVDVECKIMDALSGVGETCYA